MLHVFYRCMQSPGFDTDLPVYQEMNHTDFLDQLTSRVVSPLLVVLTLF